MALEDLVTLIKNSSGLLKQRNLAILRNYLDTSVEQDIINEIYRLQTIEDIRILWAAGLTSPLQRAALTRYDQIKAFIARE